MDTVFIHDLNLSAFIGIYEWEQRVQQTLKFDLELSIQASAAKQGDYLDYHKISLEIAQWLADKKFDWLERLADQLVDHLFAKFPIENINMQISKPYVLKPKVGISITRTRSKS